ncbi:hypothetical protein Pcinc_012680 [Petrolisthes cinctipes]|uniref:Uncharacterized protein n=1 Tax=Petrolisthes cinctipes TaxID=88211 RepID=A0AAE1G0H3_PETCI|nr:hypothetical protein Pcinc_012680 [Petrolisthes cinctipes]
MFWKQRKNGIKLPHSLGFTGENDQICFRVPEEKLHSLDGAPTLRAYDQYILRDMLEICKPFEDATDCAQRQNSVSSSLVILCVRGLNFHLDQMQTKYNRALVFGLKKSVQKRLQLYEDRKAYQLATVLDPRFKMDCCSDEGKKANLKSSSTTTAQYMAKEATSTNSMDTGTEPPQENAGSSSSGNSEPKGKKLFSLMASSVQQSTDKTQVQEAINGEIQRYPNQPCISDETDVFFTRRSAWTHFQLYSSKAATNT